MRIRTEAAARNGNGRAPPASASSTAPRSAAASTTSPATGSGTSTPSWAARRRGSGSAGRDACRELVREAAAWGGGLTAPVNNAGVQPTQPLPGMTAARWRAVVDTNLGSVFACTQAPCPL
ncbi:conserved hypothetical protein [Streptomyces sviceus ATCC 29083]|uniref:Uncharacterized protein n=1 Tax=Streptomyces sviceus (strain ATCC 29083 / DSM 924 / JCM 4929 / NBRC 13980 / NCIMB 11184 / NRRL 5439 / UC 5370) TaxID=463191 RepID=B5HNX3_STRX2|nr:conserved hypothetical protein [Streptomyces sviceus ATCC 29083]